MRQGFSLVELSIVLVILGLLTGGILAGQSLIRASELRSVSIDMARYRTAIYAFRDKYFYLPGDMPNAVRVWGAQTGSTNDGRDNACAVLTTAATGTATCNGDGDGIINRNTGNCIPMYERFRFWQHLANAGLIEGRFSGTVNDATDFWTCRRSIIGQNVPPSRIANAGFDVLHVNGTVVGSPTVNYLLFGTPFYYGPESTYIELYDRAITPQEAWNIDNKMDDGMPYAGMLIEALGSNISCVTAVSATGTYRLDATAIACSLKYKL